MTSVAKIDADMKCVFYAAERLFNAVICNIIFYDFFVDKWHDRRDTGKAEFFQCLFRHCIQNIVTYKRRQRHNSINAALRVRFSGIFIDFTGADKGDNRCNGSKITGFLISSISQMVNKSIAEERCNTSYFYLSPPFVRIFPMLFYR